MTNTPDYRMKLPGMTEKEIEEVQEEIGGDLYDIIDTYQRQPRGNEFDLAYAHFRMDIQKLANRSPYTDDAVHHVARYRLQELMAQMMLDDHIPLQELYASMLETLTTLVVQAHKKKGIDLDD